jgi:hypothetical protein
MRLDSGIGGVPVVDRLDVQIITYAPTVFYHCQHCEVTFSEAGLGDRVHREQAANSLPDDLRSEFEELTLGLHDLAMRFGDRLRLRLIDAASLEGFIKSVRWRIGRYPAVVIDGKKAAAGSDVKDLVQLVGARLDEPNRRVVAEEEFETRRS